MKNHAFILSILEAGTVSHETLEEYVAELMFRLEQQLVVRIDQRKARRWLLKDIEGQTSRIFEMERSLREEELTGDSVTRLRFLDQHVIDLNVRINASAVEAFQDGRARGFKEGIEEGLKRARDFHRGKEAALSQAISADNNSEISPPAPETIVMVDDEDGDGLRSNTSNFWIGFGPGRGL